MTVVVAQTVRGAGQAATATPTITIPTAPGAGDAVYVVVGTLNGSAHNVTSVSGLGATWTVAFTSSNVGVAVGTGATASGTVTVTMNSSSDYKIDAYVVSGLAQPTAADGIGLGANLSGTGPALLARDGQFVVQMAAVIPGSATLTDGSALAPTTGWTVGAAAGTSGGSAASAYRLPTETAWTSHRVDYTAPSMSGNYSAIVGLGAKPNQIVMRGKTTQRYNGSPSQNRTIPVPANVKVGDLMVLMVSWYDTISTPSGWTLQGKVAYATTPNPASYVFTKTAASGDAGSNVPLNGTAPTNGGSAAIAAYAGVSSFTFTQSAQQQTTTPSIPARTLTNADSVYLYGINAYYASGSGATVALTAATGQNVRARIDYATDSTSYFLLTYGEESPGATGSTGSRSGTLSSSTIYSTGWSMELVPTSSGQTIAVGRAAVTATAQPMSSSGVFARSVETDTARPVARQLGPLSVPVGLASSTATAQPTTSRSTIPVAVGGAAATATAQPLGLGFGGPAVVTVKPAVHANDAISIRVARSTIPISVGPASDVASASSAVPVQSTFRKVLGLAQTADRPIWQFKPDPLVRTVGRAGDFTLEGLPSEVATPMTLAYGSDPVRYRTSDYWAATTTAATTRTITLPSGIQAGDGLILVVVAGYPAYTGTTFDLATPTGWYADYVTADPASKTSYPFGTNAFGWTRAWIFTKTAVAGDGGSTVTLAATDSVLFAVAVAAYAGAMNLSVPRISGGVPVNNSRKGVYTLAGSSVSRGGPLEVFTHGTSIATGRVVSVYFDRDRGPTWPWTTVHDAPSTDVMRTPTNQTNLHVNIADTSGKEMLDAAIAQGWNPDGAAVPPYENSHSKWQDFYTDPDTGSVLADSVQGGMAFFFLTAQQLRIIPVGRAEVRSSTQTPWVMGGQPIGSRPLNRAAVTEIARPAPGSALIRMARLTARSVGRAVTTLRGTPITVTVGRAGVLAIAQPLAPVAQRVRVGIAPAYCGARRIHPNGGYVPGGIGGGVDEPADPTRQQRGRRHFHT